MLDVADLPMFDMTRYLYPPRPSGSVAPGQWQTFADQGWMAQYKFNGSRCLVKCFGEGKYELWNRHKEPLKYAPSKQLHQQLIDLSRIGGNIFDSELLHSKHPAIKHTICIFDWLVMNGRHLLGLDYATRFNSLMQLTQAVGREPWMFNKPGDEGANLVRMGYQIMPDIFIPDLERPFSWTGMWGALDQLNAGYTSPIIEGLVLKNPRGVLKPGFKAENNGAWMTRSRVHTGRHRF